MGWFLLAVLLQTADAANTCRSLSRGGVELNPALPQSCAGIIGMKATVMSSVMLMPKQHRKWGWIAMAGSGGVGLGVSIALKD